MIERLAEYKRAFQAFFLTLLVLFVGLAYAYRGESKEKESEYLVLSQNVRDLLSKSSFNEALFESVTTFLKTHPESRPGVEQTIAQHLIAVGEEAKAQALASKALMRAKTHAPYYHEFSMATLLMEKGALVEALTVACSLKDKMQHDELLWQGTTMKRSAHLMSANMLRIAMLQRALGQRSQELLSLTALKDFLGLSSGTKETLTADEQTCKAFIAEFSSSSRSLAEYVREREVALR